MHEYETRLCSGFLVVPQQEIDCRPVLTGISSADYTLLNGMCLMVMYSLSYRARGCS